MVEKILMPLDTKASVLLADDDRTTRIVVSKILEIGNYDITAVENGLDAITMIKERHFDYLITDLMMPEIEGIELISEVINIQPETKIIAISSDELAGHSSLLSVAQAVGASAAIQKPIRPDVLLSTMRSI